jgi:hypothetical protein
MSSRSSTKTIHVINNPDEPAPFCNFEQHGLKLFTSTGTISMPTFPNYRLDTAPVCDPDISTSIKDIEAEPLFDFKIYPNPATDVFCVESSSDINNSMIRIIELHGKVMWQGPYEKYICVQTSFLKNGLYFVEVMQNHKRINTEKLIVIK